MKTWISECIVEDPLCLYDVLLPEVHAIFHLVRFKFKQVKLLTLARVTITKSSWATRSILLCSVRVCSNMSNMPRNMSV